MRVSKDLWAYNRVGTVNKTQTIRNVLMNNPKVKIRDVAKAVGVMNTTVYSIRKELGLTLALDSAPVRLPHYSLDVAYDAVEKADMLRYEDMGYTPSDNVIRTGIESDPVNHPAHYTVGGIETIDFIEAKKLSYNLGNVIKYTTRADHKGKKVEDLQKALWYLNRELQNLQK